MKISSLSYILIESTDPDQWCKYATDVLGLQVVCPAGGKEDSVYLKCDNRPWRIAVQKGSSDRYLLSGWEISDSVGFNAVCKKLTEQNIAFSRGTAEEIAERQVSDLIRLQDPAGNVLELCLGCGLDFEPFVSPLGVSHFVTGDDGDLGLGHVVLCAADLTKTRNFYHSCLGFNDSDYMEVPNPDGSSSGIHFMHCDNPRHHSLALYGVPGEAFPAGCVHAMLEVPDVDTVGKCLERVENAGIHIFSTLGRHTNDRMLSFYMMTPTGFALEYGCHGRLLDLSNFRPTITTGRGSLWGHRFQIPSMPAN